MKLTFLKNDNYDIDEMEGKYSKFIAQCGLRFAGKTNPFLDLA